MFSLVKKIVKGGLALAVVGALVGVGAVLIAGPARSHAVMNQMQTNIHSLIDQSVDDPTALRSDLMELEKQYPERIGKVRGDLAELNQQIHELEREKVIAEKVVALADRDLAVLEPRWARAAANRGSGDEVQLAAVEFNDHVMSYDRAVRKLSQIRQTRVSYQNRANDSEHDLLYLHQQAQRLEDFLGKLEQERADFQTQIQQLNRQVDAVARNQRLIEIMEARNKTLQECSRYESASLEQLTAKLNETRSRQEAELEVLSNAQRLVDYEEEARMELDAEHQATETQPTAAGLRSASLR
jgi:predicted RNase H-like nuclease (RuvC/YqgF family)